MQGGVHDQEQKRPQPQPLVQADASERGVGHHGVGHQHRHVHHKVARRLLHRAPPFESAFTKSTSPTTSATGMRIQTLRLASLAWR